MRTCGRTRAAFPAFSGVGRRDLQRTTPAACVGDPPRAGGGASSCRTGTGGGGSGLSRESELSFCRHLLPAPLLRGIVGASASRSLREVSLLFPLPSPKVGVKRVRVRVGGWGCPRPPSGAAATATTIGIWRRAVPSRSRSPCRLRWRCVCEPPERRPPC